MKTFATFAILLLGLALEPSAQSIRRMLINADYTFYSENFEDAIHLYEAVLTRRPESDKAMYHKMIAEYMTVKRTEDVTPLIDFYKDASASDRFFHYWMDRIYLGQYNFHHAREHFKTFAIVAL